MKALLARGSLISFTLVVMAALALAACNTVQGVGRDISSVGKKGEEVID